MEKLPGIHDVAAMAGVSISTASVVLNNVEGARVSLATRERIQDAARTLGYVPNPMARGLRARKSDVIALIGDRLATTPFAGQMIEGAQRTAWSHGVVLVIMTTAGDPEQETAAFRVARERRMDGIILATTSHTVIDVPAGMPTVLLNAEPTHGSHTHVVPDEVGGAVAAVDELVAAGHRRIGFANVSNSHAARLRLQGYLGALERAGIRADPDTVVEDHEAVSTGGFRAAGILLDRVEPPTAIFCFNDRMAMGAYRAARLRGLRIPEDLSIVGFDDQEFVADAVEPGLTTIALPHLEMGRRAVEALLGISEPTASGLGDQITIDCPIVRRGSVMPPKFP